MPHRSPDMGRRGRVGDSVYWAAPLTWYGAGWFTSDGGSREGNGMTELLAGTVTFLFTDLEVSTRLWDREPEAMGQSLARHDSILRDVIALHEGQLVKGRGDGVHAVFVTADAALRAATDAQGRLKAERWTVSEQLRVRMG